MGNNESTSGKKNAQFNRSFNCKNSGGNFPAQNGSVSNGNHQKTRRAMSEMGDGFQTSINFNQNSSQSSGPIPRQPATKSEILVGDQEAPKPKNPSRPIPIQPVPPMMTQSATMQPNYGFNTRGMLNKNDRDVCAQNGFRPQLFPVRPMMVPRAPPMHPMRMMQPPFFPGVRPVMVNPRPALVAPYSWRPGFMQPQPMQPGFIPRYPCRPMLLAIEPPRNFCRRNQVNITEIVEPPEEPEPTIPTLKLIDDKITKTDVTKGPTYPMYLSSYISSPVSSQRLSKNNRNRHLLDNDDETFQENLNRSRENILDRTPLLVVSQSAKEVMARNEEILAQAELNEKSKPVSYMINATASENDGDENGSVELELNNVGKRWEILETPKPTRRLEMEFGEERTSNNIRRVVAQQPQLVTKDWPKETHIDDVVGNQVKPEEQVDEKYKRSDHDDKNGMFQSSPYQPEPLFVQRNQVSLDNFPRHEAFIEPVKFPQLPSTKSGLNAPDDIDFNPIDAWNHIHVSDYSVDPELGGSKFQTDYPDNRIHEKIRVHLVRSGPGQKMKTSSYSMPKSEPIRHPNNFPPNNYPNSNKPSYHEIEKINGHLESIPDNKIMQNATGINHQPNSQPKPHDWFQHLETQFETSLARTDKGIQQFRDQTLQRNQQQFSQPDNPKPPPKNVHSVKPFLYVLRKTDDSELINIDRINSTSNYPFALLTKYYDQEMQFIGDRQNFPNNDGSNQVYPKTQVDTYRSFTQENLQNEPIYVPKPDYEFDYGIYYRGNRPLPINQQQQQNFTANNYRSINISNQINYQNGINDRNVSMDNRQYGLEQQNQVYNKSAYGNRPNVESYANQVDHQQNNLVYNKQATMSINGNQFGSSVQNRLQPTQNFGCNQQKGPYSNLYRKNDLNGMQPTQNSDLENTPLGYRQYPRLPRVTFDPDNQVINDKNPNNIVIPEKFIANSPTMQTKSMQNLPSHPWSYKYSGGNENLPINRWPNSMGDAKMNKYTNNFTDSLVQGFEPVRPSSYQQYGLEQEEGDRKFGGQVDQKWARRGFPEAYDVN